MRERKKRIKSDGANKKKETRIERERERHTVKKLLHTPGCVVHLNSKSSLEVVH